MSAARTMTADAIVVTWRSGERVLGCLERLADQLQPGRTFVVDNGSGDGTVASVRASFPSVRVLELPENRGFGAAVNAGAALGDGEAIVLVNDDVEIEQGFVDAIVAPLQADGRCAMVAGMTMIPDSDRVDAFGIELDVTLAAYNRLRRRPPQESPGRLAMPSGGAAAYRRSAFERAGGFDERLHAYGEDVDLGLRLLLEGWSAGAAPEARGTHLGGATIVVDSPLQRELGGFARGFLLRRYGVLRTRACARALLFEALVVGWGLVAHRTTVPLRARMRGWRAGGGKRLPIPPQAIDRTITAREAFWRLRHAR
jgi:N-acetylglucosaminyl-diphospho-decaprenol L-rhamnosyltransferase